MSEQNPTAQPKVKMTVTFIDVDDVQQENDIVLELDAVLAPSSVENFLAYVKKGQYDGSIFHRVIPGFMIQGGGFDENMSQLATEAPVRTKLKTV